MRNFRPPAELLNEIEQVLSARRPTRGHVAEPHPLEHALLVLFSSDRFDAIALTIGVDEDLSMELSLGDCENPESEMTAPLRLAGRRLGELRAFHARENAFSYQDHILLKQAAQQLALFITGPGRYLLRRARQQSEATETTRVATAGESPRS